MVESVNKLGNIYMDNSGGNYAGNVYDKEGVAPALNTGNNPSDRSTNNLEQRLEVQQDGISNTLTTVQKDNYVLEQNPISTKGKNLDVAKTILSGYERTNMTGFNSDNAVLVKHQQDAIQTEDDVSRTLVAGTHGNADIFTKTVVKVTPDAKHQQDNIMTEDDICMTQCAGLSGRYNVLTDYAIRKLTPKECFRLMGVKDEDYDKLTVSNSQKYKQAGNSIVVDVLMAIFENMFINDCEKSGLF